MSFFRLSSNLYCTNCRYFFMPIHPKCENRFNLWQLAGKCIARFVYNQLFSKRLIRHLVERWNAIVRRSIEIQSVNILLMFPNCCCCGVDFMQCWFLFNFVSSILLEKIVQHKWFFMQNKLQYSLLAQVWKLNALFSIWFKYPE